MRHIVNHISCEHETGLFNQRGFCRQVLDYRFNGIACYFAFGLADLFYFFLESIRACLQRIGLAIKPDEHVGEKLSADRWRESRIPLNVTVKAKKSPARRLEADGRSLSGKSAKARILPSGFGPATGLPSGGLFL